MSANSSKIESLNTPPACNYWQPCPIFYHSKTANKHYIIFTPDANDSKNCVVYDCHKDGYLDLTEYPNDFVPLAATHALDKDAENLYIFGGEGAGGSGSLFGILNLVTGDWIYSSANNIALQRLVYGQSYFIENNSKREIHSFGTTSLLRNESSHLIHFCNNSKKTFKEVKKYQASNNCSTCDGLPVFMEAQSKMLISTDSSDKLYSFDLYAQYPNAIITLPDIGFCDRIRRKFLIVFNDILCVFDGDRTSSKLWCRCLGNKTSDSWICTEFYVEKFEYAIVTHEYDDYIHFINTDGSNLFHQKILVHKLVPETLIMDKYNKLVFGFMGRIQMQVCLPFYDYQHISQIILLYFPLHLEKNKKMRNMKGGIKYRDMRVGSGKLIEDGDKIKVYYVGQLEDKHVFDKTISGEGFEFNFGADDVIKGWDIGLKGMRVGGKRKLVIPPKLAYGSNGMPPRVPPHATLTFTIEIKS